MKLSVREWKINDIEKIVNYWHSLSPKYLKTLGADKSKFPYKEEWKKKLSSEFLKPKEQQNFYYIIWLIDEAPVGHSNIDHIKFGRSAHMHLHLWLSEKRKRGIGYEFLTKSIPYFFDLFELDKLYCEPYAYNEAPNRTVKKLGFEIVKEYETTPGWNTFYQKVNKYKMTKKSFSFQLKNNSESYII